MTPSSPRLRWIAVAFLGACAGSGGDPAETVVRDSAGVHIVESAATAGWAAGEAWTVSSEPTMEIGSGRRGEADQLHRAFSAVRQSDGTVVVANGGTGELRFYGADGQHLRSVGRTGEGPGEFQDLQRVWLLSRDSLLAYDFFPARLSVFGPGGELVRSLHVRAPDGRQVIVRGAFADHSLLVAAAPIWSAPGATTGVVRDSVPYYRADPSGAVVDTVGWFPSAETFRFASEDGWRLTGVPFARVPVVAVTDDGFYFGRADDYEIRTYDAAGRLERIVRLPEQRRAVTGADVERFRTDRLERAEREGTRPSMERLLSQLPYPDRLPPYDALHVDAAGHLWAADYRADPAAPRIWRVFSPTGALLGAVELPPRLEPLHIGDDFLLARWTDELGIESIRLYSLNRHR